MIICFRMKLSNFFNAKVVARNILNERTSLDDDDAW